MKKIILILIICFIGSILNLKGQELHSSVKGVVLDQASEAPIAFATVLIVGGEQPLGATSDEEGKFRIDHVPVGRYSLKISSIGYEAAHLSGVLVSSAKETSLTIALKEAIYSIDAVTIKPKEEKEQSINKMASVSARQLSMEEANRYAGGFDDPARLAGSFAGVATSFLESNGIVIRGNAPKGLLWRIEGVEVPNPNHFGEITGFGAGGITALSSQMLANSDFLTGAFPAEYGNGLSGVFDLSMRKGNNEKYEHTFQAGFMGLDVSSEGPFKKEGRASYLFNYRYSTFGIIDAVLPEGVMGIAYQDLSLKLHLPTKKAGTFSLWGLGFIDRAKSKEDTDTTTVWEYYEDIEREDSRISTGVLGLTHKYFVGEKTYLKTVLSASTNDLTSENGRLDDTFSNVFPTNDIRYNTFNLRLSSFINHKFNAKHTNRTGIIASRLNYNIGLKQAQVFGEELTEIVDEMGSSYLFQAYSQSSFHLGKKLTINPGLHAQYFALSKKYSVEPRFGAVLQLNDRQSLNLGYGLHSQLEKLNFYFSKIQTPSDIKQPNKDLDFSKAHHLVLGYNHQLGAHTRLRIEPYAQFLYNIPVVPNSYYSFINLEDDFFVNEELVNEGKGRNIGVDVTLERFLNDGWYYLATASVFDSKYQGGDAIWRDTRFNKGFVGNVLIGKEWTVGKKNLFSASAKWTYFGGDRIHPIDREASLASRDIVEDYSRAFETQKPNSNMLHLTFTYRVNKPRHASLWSLQILNALATKEQYGYKYNFSAHTIDKDEVTIIVPNLSYKIEF